MSQFKGFAGNTEPQLRQWFAYLLKQDSTGIATDGALTGLGVSQTATASASVVVGKGCGVVQDSLLNGATPLVLDSDFTLDVLTANPMGGVPRNDIVVFDAATLSGGTGGVRVIVGTPNASPTDPTVPATAIPLARLRHAASATTVPTSKIDDLRVFTGPFTPASPLVAVTVGGGFAASNAPQVRKVGDRVYMRGGITNTGLSASTTHTGVMTIPAGYRPPISWYLVVASSAADRQGKAVVGSDGSIALQTPPSLGAYYLFDGLSWDLT